MAKKSISVHELAKKHYPKLPLPEHWVQYIGPVEVKFRQMVWGKSGQGKTTYVIQLCIALSSIGKVYYNSVEEGEGASMQGNLVRNRVPELCKPGSFVMGDRDTFDEMYAKLANGRNRIRFVVIDSAQYMKLTTEQYQRLHEDFPRIGIIIISWASEGGEPKGIHAAAIRYMVDIKTRVDKGVARTDSRFGPTVPYQVIPWDKEEKPAAKGKAQADPQQQALALAS